MQTAQSALSRRLGALHVANDVAVNLELTSEVESIGRSRPFAGPVLRCMAVDEQRALAELKRRIGALPDDLVVSGDVDAAFRRFLVARKWDLDKAEEQLRATLKWRSDEFRLQKFLVRRALVLNELEATTSHVSLCAGQPAASATRARAHASARKPAPGVLQAGVAGDFDKCGWL